MGEMESAPGVLLSSIYGISASEVLVEKLYFLMCEQDSGILLQDVSASTYSFGQLSIHHEIVHMLFCFGKF